MEFYLNKITRPPHPQENGLCRVGTSEGENPGGHPGMLSTRDTGQVCHYDTRLPDKYYQMSVKRPVSLRREVISCCGVREGRQRPWVESGSEVEMGGCGLEAIA